MLDSFKLKIRLLFFAQFILDGRVKLQQLVDALFCGLMAQKYPGGTFPRQCMEGMKPPQTVLVGRGWCQAVQLVCQGLFLSLCNVPGSLPCSFHGTWVGPSMNRDARHWAESMKMNDLPLSALQLNVHMHRQC